MELLPTPARRTFIVRALETMRRQQSDDPIVNAPIREPGDRDFPDRWEPSVEGVRRLAERILKHADLGWLRATVEGFHGRPGRDEWRVYSGSDHHQGTAAWYAGFDEEESLCFFGVDLDGVREANAIVGTMCHEIAHTYRDVHGLAIDDRALEEELTDLTTVFLGFGVLSTNASYVYRSGGIAGASMTGHRWSHEKRGYLAVEELAYALAYQVGLRGGADAPRVASLLDPTQRDCFEAALAEPGIVTKGARPPVPLWLGMAILLVVPILAFLGLRLAAPAPSGECAADVDCPESRPSCISHLCVHTCTDDADCSAREVCREVTAHLRVCGRR